jgi:hypothetical protein
LKSKVDQTPGVTIWRWHDLRKTAWTGMTRLGVSRDHAEAALNHVSARSALERTYDRHDFAPEVIAAHRRWHSHVIALVTNAPSAEVTNSQSAWQTPEQDLAQTNIPRVSGARFRTRASTAGRALCRGDPAPSEGAKFERTVSMGIRARPRIRRAVPSSGEAAKSSHPTNMPSDQSKIVNDVSLRDLIKQIPAAHWDLAKAIWPESVGGPLDSIQAVMASRTKREADDDWLLMQVGLLRRGENGVTLTKGRP